MVGAVRRGFACSPARSQAGRVGRLLSPAVLDALPTGAEAHPWGPIHSDTCAFPCNFPKYYFAIISSDLSGIPKYIQLRLKL